jgi:GrpB-like predicted nucleotidyltransferase (UPF0157 family)
MSSPNHEPDGVDVSEEYLEDITVGELVPHNAPIELAEYDPAWPAQFAREAERIRTVLGEVAVQVEHAGSTSVAGLPAKPIIDIVLAVPDSTDEVAYVQPLESAGYRLTIREPEWMEHRLLKGPDTNINLHVFSVDTPEIERMLRFRDWLRTHDDERELYANEKRTLAAREWRYVQHYASAKSEVVQQIMARAGTATAINGPQALAEAD